MPDTLRDRNALKTLLADNNIGAITAQALRDLLISIYVKSDVDAAIAAVDPRILLRPFKLIHLQPGVTGTGTSLDPYVGWDSVVNGLSEGETGKFGNGIFQAASELWLKNSQVSLAGSGMTIIRSSQAAYPSQSITSLTWEASILGNRVTATKVAHGYSAGDQVVVGGANQPEYNTCATIYDITPDAFKYYIVGSPVSPATGTITAKKARVLLKIGKTYQTTFGGDMCWRPRIEGIILDGQGQIEVGLYLRCWLGGSLDRIHFRNFVEYDAKASEVINSHFNEMFSVYGPTYPVSTSGPKNSFLLGERDPNPVFAAEDDTPRAEIIAGAFNVTISDLYGFGATDTLIYIPSGFGCTVVNGNAGGSTTCIRFGHDTAQFNIEGTDCEFGGNLIIDGVGHTLDRLNMPACSLTINGVGNVINGTGVKGDHTIKDLSTVNIVNNCNAYSRVINTTVPTITGTHPDKIIHQVDGGLRTLVKGPVKNETRSLLGNPVTHTNYLEGFRAGHFATTTDGTFLIDINADLDMTDPTVIAANAAMKMLLKAVTFFGTLGAANLLISGANLRYARAQSDTGGNVAFDMFSVGQVGGFVSLTANGHLMRIGNGLPDQTNDAEVLAATAIEINQANVVKIINRLIAMAGLGVGNSAAATTLGSVVKKMEVFDAAGASLGFVPIYNTIT